VSENCPSLFRICWWLKRPPGGSGSRRFRVRNGGSANSFSQGVEFASSQPGLCAVANCFVYQGLSLFSLYAVRSPRSRVRNRGGYIEYTPLVRTHANCGLRRGKKEGARGAGRVAPGRTSGRDPGLRLFGFGPKDAPELHETPPPVCFPKIFSGCPVFCALPVTHRARSIPDAPRPLSVLRSPCRRLHGTLTIRRGTP
jgi:hypothetical protein